MTLEIVRRVRGNLHGSIDMTKLEDLVIAHPLTQRLRRVKQTAFLSLVFPGATHTRFEHSLGVMHLAGVAWDRLKANQQRLAVTMNRYEDFKNKEKDNTSSNHGILSPTFDVMDEIFSSDYILQTLRLAGVLHDLGHPPFSHSGERFLPTVDKILNANPGLPDYLVTFLKNYSESKINKGVNPKEITVRHEIFTLILVEKLLSEVYAENPNLSLKIDPQDVISIIAPEIPPKEGSPLLKFKANKLCHELISGEFDIDRMDYLQRDSRECGVVYGIFDADRILDSLAIYYDEKEKAFHLAIQYSGLAAFEDYLRARQSMYVQLYFHKTSVAAEAMIKHLYKSLNGWSLPANIDEFAKIDENSVDTQIRLTINKLSDTTLKESLNKTLDDLLLNRRLWKRVYEISGLPEETKNNPAIENAKNILTQLGLDYEQVSSSSSLTNFRPRQKNKVSQNYLRLIKKDINQFPRIMPIEDHSSIFSGNIVVHITRLYAKEREKSRSIQDAKKALMKI